MSERIRAFRVVRRDVGVEVPFAISRETREAAALAFVVLEDDAGREGLGEAAPFPSLTYDTIETAEVAAAALAAATVGHSPVQALRRLRADAAALKAKSVTSFVAVETALWDLLARQHEAPLALLWGGAMLPSVETDVTLPIMTPEQVPRFWGRYAEHRFRTVKIKVAGVVDDDVARVMALVRAAGPDVVVTLDGNQGYRVDGAVRLCAELARHGVRPLFFEQPLPEDDWRGHRELTDRLEVPVCLDETVRTPADAVRAASERTARIINIKIMKSGVEDARRIIAVAEAAGIDLMIGGMLESEVAMGTSLALAAGTGAVRYFDLDTPFFLTERVTEASPWHAPSALLQAPAGPGHGLRLNAPCA